MVGRRSKIVISSLRPSSVVWTDPRIQFVAVDFLGSQEKAVKALRELCQDITHVYFTSYVHNDDLNKLVEKNVPLFKNFMEVIERHYGCHLGPTKQPITEDIPRYEDRGLNFYYQQEDFLFEVQKRRNQWSYNIIRPFGIIGYTPSANGMSLAVSFAVYFLLNLELGQSAPFPGSSVVLDFPEDISYSPSIADMSVWATTNERARNQAFNQVSGDPVVMRYFWPQLAAYFGVEMDEVTTLQSDINDWIKDKRPVWERVVAKYGGKVEAFDWCTWGMFEWAYCQRHWPALPSVTKARSLGWMRVDTAMQCWEETFGTFENAGILPKASVIRAALKEGK
ncbi:hypothetical protein SLS54_009748 [Diplodia seriata]